MKTKHILAFLCLFILVLSCEKQKYPAAAPTETEGIDGNWNLVLATGGLAGISETYQVGEILWTFDSSDSSVVVVNNVNSGIYYSLPAGTYPFWESSNSNGDLVINVNGEEMGVRTISNDTLDIGADQVILDGFSLKFVR
jgi:hypothetical protein